MPKRIPFIDEAYWEKVNPYLSQLIAPPTGGINLWTNATQPAGLNSDDVGRTGWNLDAGCLQRWNGSSWDNLQPSLVTIAPVITQLFQSWNPSPPPQWLVNLILDAINSWSPGAIPPWLEQALKTQINALTLGDIVNLLNQWSPAEGSPVDQLIDAAMSSGGLTAAQAISIISNWNSAVPTWLANYINSRIAAIALSALAGNATLPQIQTALNQWFNGNLKPYIDGLLNVGNMGGTASFPQIEAAIQAWFTNNLKPYIDSGDANARAYGDQIRATLLTKVDANYADLLNKLNTHGHAGGGTTQAPTPAPTSSQTPAPTSSSTPAPTQAPSSTFHWGSNATISSAGGVAFIGTGIESSGPLSISMWTYDASFSADLAVTVIKIPGKINGVNNIPSDISYGSLVGTQGAQLLNFTLKWASRSFIGPASTIGVSTPTTSSDKGYNLYLVVNSGTRYEIGNTAYRNTVVGFSNVGSGSTPSMTITYSGPTTDTRS